MSYYPRNRGDLLQELRTGVPQELWTKQRRGTCLFWPRILVGDIFLMLSSGCEVEILADGRLVIAGQDQLLAGASLPIGVGVANVMQFAQVNLATAVEMASHHPARLLRRDVVTLRPGDVADLVLFDMETLDRPTLTVRATIAAGELVFGALAQTV